MREEKIKNMYYFYQHEFASKQMEVEKFMVSEATEIQKDKYGNLIIKY